MAAVFTAEYRQPGRSFLTVRVRFHLDEHIPLGVAAGLRRRGIDVTCAAEIGLLGVGDKEQLSFATQSGGALVTQDAGLRLNILDKTPCKPGGRDRTRTCDLLRVKQAL